MGEHTEISWCDATFNPWWGCERVSPGCQHCYAETFAKRTGHDVWGKGGERRFFGDSHWAEPLKWNAKAAAAGERRRVFCASMADVFENRPDLDAPRERLWDLIGDTPQLDWLLLTKRPENIARLVDELTPNVWLGTTVEDQTRAELRIPHLLAFPAAVRFLSCEPLLGPVNVANVLGPFGVEWVITGGESGPGHRKLDPTWAASLRDQCADAGVAFFHKQNGGATPKAGGKLLDGREHCEFPRAAVPA